MSKRMSHENIQISKLEVLQNMCLSESTQVCLFLSCLCVCVCVAFYICLCVFVRV